MTSNRPHLATAASTRPLTSASELTSHLTAWHSDPGYWALMYSAAF